MPFHSGYGYYGTGDWLWSIFSTALFIVLVSLAIMLLVRIFSGPRRQGPGAPAQRGGPWFGPGPGASSVTPPAWGERATSEAEGAERILAERYARGELSEEQYRSRLEVLRQTAAGWAQPGPQPTAQQSWPGQQHPQQQPAEQPMAPAASAGQGGPTEEVR